MELTIHYQVCIRSLETEATWTYLQVPSCVFLTAFCVVVGLLAVAGVAARHTYTHKKKNTDNFFYRKLIKGSQFLVRVKNDQIGQTLEAFKQLLRTVPVFNVRKMSA